MDKYLISVDNAFELKNVQFIDLRSPIEFEEAHIPGAINIPLLEDDERKIVGTIYKQHSPDLALEEGFGFIAPKLPDICLKIKNIGNAYYPVIYCWRGGMRSQALSNVLDIMSIKHFRLYGGYKAFRNYVLEYFSQPFKQNVIVLDGLTGVGKTDLIQEIIKLGLPAIDLESLANNHGSVFGCIGLGKQPQQKHFEGLLLAKCLKQKDKPNIIVECESRRIGSVSIPETFFTAMKNGQHILIHDIIENRIKRITDNYVIENNDQNRESIRNAIYGLKKRLGLKNTNNLIYLFENNEYSKVVEILLKDYYDPLYAFPSEHSNKYKINISSVDMAYAVDVLRSLIG